MRGHSGKNISRRMRRKMAGDMCRRLRRNLSGATNSSFYSLPDVVAARLRRRYLECRAILQDHAQVGNAFGELRNIPGRANRSMR